MSVRRHIVVLGIGFVAALLVAESAVGQRPGLETPRTNERAMKGSIRGVVAVPGGASLTESVRVTLSTFNGTLAMIFTDNFGRFDFQELNPGNYEVQVETNGAQYEVVSQSVQVFRGAPSMVTISLRGKNAATTRRTRGKTVSVAELGADVPKAARKEFELATKAAQEMKTDEAVAHLRKAIAIYPNFVMARNDLGTQFLAQGKLEEAEQEFRSAVLIDEKAFNPRLNLGIVLVQQNSFTEAAEVLSRAIALNPESPAARLYAGLAQMGLNNMDDAEKYLKAAYALGGSSYSVALFHLGQVCMNKGERGQALEAFEGYLRDSPDAANADQVRKLIAMLRP